MKDELINILMKYQINYYQNEKELQSVVSDILLKEKINFKREFTLSESNIIDFLLTDGTGIEIKIKGSGMSILRQLKRYSNEDKIERILLITTKRIFLPDKLSGKSCKLYYINSL